MTPQESEFMQRYSRRVELSNLFTVEDLSEEIRASAERVLNCTTVREILTATCTYIVEGVTGGAVSHTLLALLRRYRAVSPQSGIVPQPHPSRLTQLESDISENREASPVNSTKPEERPVLRANEAMQMRLQTLLTSTSRTWGQRRLLIADEILARARRDSVQSLPAHFLLSNNPQSMRAARERILEDIDSLYQSGQIVNIGELNPVRYLDDIIDKNALNQHVLNTLRERHRLSSAGPPSRTEHDWKIMESRIQRYISDGFYVEELSSGITLDSLLSRSAIDLEDYLANQNARRTEQLQPRLYERRLRERQRHVSRYESGHRDVEAVQAFQSARNDLIDAAQLPNHVAESLRRSNLTLDQLIERIDELRSTESRVQTALTESLNERVNCDLDVITDGNIQSTEYRLATHRSSTAVRVGGSIHILPIEGCLNCPRQLYFRANDAHFDDHIW